MKLGWYSEIMDGHFGHAIYRKPNGSEVKITTVVNTDALRANGEPFGESYPGSAHGDEVQVGEVVSLVKSCFRNFYNDDPRFNKSRPRNNRGGGRNSRNRRSNRGQRDS
jgi:hypothetical protein